MGTRKITAAETLEAVRDAGGDVEQARQALGIGKATIYRRLADTETERVPVYLAAPYADILRRNEIAGLWGRLEAFVRQEAEDSGDAVLLDIGSESRKATAEELRMMVAEEGDEYLEDAVASDIYLEADEIIQAAAEGRVYFVPE